MNQQERTETDGERFMRLYWMERLDRLRSGQEDIPAIPLRDYFAAQALIGLTAGRVVLIGHGDANEACLTIDGEAVDAYRYADEMLKARKQ